MYLSPVRYSYTALMVTQFSEIDTPQAQAILAQYGFDGHSYWACLGALFGLFIFFRSLVVFSLALQDRKRQQTDNDTRNSNIPTKGAAQITSD